MRRLVLIIALLVIAPIVEIGVLVAVGQQIGVGPTLLLMLATSALGGVLLRHQGGRAWRAFQADVTNGVPPGPSATDGLLVLIGGVFMLVPGFVSDVIGVLLIAPPSRRVARAFVMQMVTRRLTPAASSTLFGP
ncbi:MAG: FxsA family protein, partial [Micromonosporaceae bacterium]